MTNVNRSAVASTTLIAFSLLVPCVAKAQRMASSAGSKSNVMQIAHARPIETHVVAARASAGSRSAPKALSGVRFNSTTNSFESSDGSFVSLQDLLNPVPGFGFDYHHLSVINQDLDIKAVIDPVTEWKLAIAERVHRNRPRFSGPEFFLLDGGGAYAVPDDSSPAQISQRNSRRSSWCRLTPPSEQAEQQATRTRRAAGARRTAPLPDVGQFTLVLQNGTESRRWRSPA